MRSTLYDKLREAGAQWMEINGCEVPAAFGPLEEEYWALKESAGLLDLSHRGRLRVRGKDAPRFLHGQVTNEVKALEVGQGNYAFFLDVHGHILADARMLRLDEQTYLVDCEGRCLAAVRETLEKHIIMDKVTLEEQDGARATGIGCLALEGPCALEVLREAVGFDPPHMCPLEHLELPDDGLRIVRASITGEFGYWILASAEKLAQLWDRSLRAGACLRARPVGFHAAEICRIEAGLPRYGAEMDEKTLPQETGQMHAVSFTKGCYLGQEVVERIRSRGHVNRKLVGLLFEGKQDTRAGMEIRAGEQVIGNLTSAAYSFGLKRTIALAMVRREFAAPGIGVKVEKLEAEVASLPFYYPAARV